MENAVTFDNLPQAVESLTRDIRELKALVAKTVHSEKKEEDKLMTIQQAAELLNLAVPTLYGLVYRSAIPYYKRNKRLYFSQKEILDWIRSGRHQTRLEIKQDAHSSLFDGK